MTNGFKVAYCIELFEFFAMYVEIMGTVGMAKMITDFKY